MNLTDTRIRNLKATDKVQKLSDGGGLYLLLRPYRRKTLAAGVPLNGKQKLLSFGAYLAVSLKDARARRDEAKELLAKDIDLGEEKKERKAAQAAKEKEEREDFAFVALEWFTAYSPRLTPKHAAMQYTLFPAIGDKPVTTDRTLRSFGGSAVHRVQRASGNSPQTHAALRAGHALRPHHRTGEI